jgi:uncharacterized protein (DUF1800 family)
MSSSELAREYYLPAIQERRRLQQRQAKGNTEEADRPDMPRPIPSPEMRRQREVIVELNQQKILRATYSERQLQEVLTDFWFNHFNVFAGKGADRMLITAYERDAIRPNVLGSFRTLLGATAHSPAMLFYLDNWMSADPNGPHGAAGDANRRRVRAPRFGIARPGAAEMTQRQQQQNRPTGINENYGRELLELHTLGVDGGYTQQDVVEVARAFTGWTIDRPRMGGEFTFDARMHDPGTKRVLGHEIKGGGEREGEQVLDILARHPSTARFIATKLATRFVSDTPSQALIDRTSKKFLETGGDLREVVRAILQSPEFLAPETRGAKVKTPLEFVVSALRTTSAEVQGGMGLIRSFQDLGMPLYMAQPPTGYADTADAWVNTGLLVNRMNFASQLMENRVPGVRVRRDGTSTTALQLGSPEFQRK